MNNSTANTYVVNEVNIAKWIILPKMASRSSWMVLARTTRHLMLHNSFLIVEFNFHFPLQNPTDKMVSIFTTHEIVYNVFQV